MNMFQGKRGVLTRLYSVEFHPRETPQMGKAQLQEWLVDQSAEALPSFSLKIKKK